MSADGSAEHSKRPPTARIFFALWPPPAVAARLGDVARVAATQLGGRPTRPETIHLTLAFLGETAVSRLPDLHALATGIAGKAFAMNIDRLGYWQHNHLFWAGFSDVPAQLSDLHGRLQAALAAAGYPVDPPGRPFTPHITLLRKLPAGTPKARLDGLSVPEHLSWPCDRFVLVRSEPASVGRLYPVLGEYSLK